MARSRTPRAFLLSGAAGGVTTLNGLAGALTLVAGPNVTITPFGSTLTIGTSGSAGGLNLPFQGVTSQNGEVFSGEVSSNFKPSEPFKFLPATSN